MKTSEALLELADKAWKGGALSADQVLALLRKVEWGDDVPTSTPSGFEDGYIDRFGQFVEERAPDQMYGKPFNPSAGEDDPALVKPVKPE